MDAAGQSFTVDEQPAPGLYRVDGVYAPSDADVPDGCLELYDHPVRGLSFWDDACDDGTDYAGHVAWYFLKGVTLTPVQPSTKGNIVNAELVNGALGKNRPVKLMRLYAPKQKPELVLYRESYNPDPLPTCGIWETVGVSDCNTDDPMFQLRLVSQWGETAHRIGDMVRVREKLMILCFDRVELTRIAIA